VVQKEGFGRETTRMTRYDQTDGLVWYRKNKNAEERYETVAPVYNEFALFHMARALILQEGETAVVPTFVDKKRHEVQVSLVQREQRQTLFGEKTTMKVHPKMQFKGMYEKSGDSVLWLTDDQCRVPVEVHSKIVIGTLVAELVDYANSACPKLIKVNKR
jgi:hypothetical protein